MAAITGRDTKPERIIRKALHARGFRYRLHAKGLPGRPDLVFPKYGAALFVNGCFWHGHDCDLFRWPKTREAFWRDKIGANVRRDTANYEKLLQNVWRVGIIWECALKGPHRLALNEVIGRVTDWLVSDKETLVIESTANEARSSAG